MLGSAVGRATASEFSNMNMEANSPATKKTKCNELSFDQNPKYLMVISTNDHSPCKRNPFKVAEVIDKAAGGKIINVTKQSNNCLFLETNSPKQSNALLQTKFLGDIPVNSTPHNFSEFYKRCY